MRFLVVLILAFSMSVSAIADGIEDARTQALGTTVTIEGYVTVASGTFTGFSFDQGFAIQDDDAGIYVSVAVNPSLNLNKHVRVTGTLSTSYNQLVLSADVADVEILQGAKRISSSEMNTGSINNTSEGLLVAVEGAVTSGPFDDLPYGWKFFMDDGSGDITIYIASTVNFNPIDVPWLVPGQQVRLTGLSSEFGDHFEIEPRRRGDLVKIGN